MSEVRRLVFMRERRDGPSSSTERRRVVKAPYDPDFSFTATPTPALLFQFSALTYNAHAIHLDPTYAREEEGYPERLVHGPLTQVFMLAGLRGYLDGKGRTGELVRSMEYRNLAPLFVGEVLRVCVREVGKGEGDGEDEVKWQLWVEGPDGGMAVKGTATTVKRRDGKGAAKL
ncbi:HotDog domain-containing protein [Echria macrotheca]|uniref:HotDog domain-containing protein n=1 Tax=Echria macrotheca TaxID=438768 RepID=A0AAJ0BD32_9PEZI|nr:HotDog domain-containing protein [Echria macrotheca]